VTRRDSDWHGRPGLSPPPASRALAGSSASAGSAAAEAGRAAERPGGPGTDSSWRIQSRCLTVTVTVARARRRPDGPGARACNSAWPGSDLTTSSPTLALSQRPCQAGPGPAGPGLSPTRITATPGRSPGHRDVSSQAESRRRCATVSPVTTVTQRQLGKRPRRARCLGPSQPVVLGGGGGGGGGGTR
jgi:hypothetical protein